MPRRREVPKRKWLPDPKYRSSVLTRFMNVVMLDGKKSTAEKIVYGALETVAEKTRDEPIKIFERALHNCKPHVEVKSRRVGGATYQVPVEVREDRRIALSMRFCSTYYLSLIKVRDISAEFSTHLILTHRPTIDVNITFS